MVDAAKFIRSKWLKSIDIEDDTPLNVTIEKVSVGKYDKNDEDEVLFLHFEEYDKPLGCGNPVLKQLMALLGRNTDKWPGERITLTVETVTAWGESHQCIRIANELPAAKRAVKRSRSRDQDGRQGDVPVAKQRPARRGERDDRD